MSAITPPKHIISILRDLEAHGYRAFLVGGCVRDCVMGRTPSDWDICTEALPQEVESVFPKCIPTGIAHGTVTVATDGGTAEVTTFRADGEYTDHRRPDTVQYISDLTGDLSRRDFTVNAMALPLSGEIFDPYGGMADIEKKLIRCVGDPKHRFDEDALRMLRAVRFSATLGFDIEPETMAAILEKAPLASTLAAERVCAELEKTLMSGDTGKLSTAIDSGLLSAYIACPRSPDLSALSFLPKCRAQRWCALCTLLMREGSIQSAEEFLTALRLDTATIQNASAGSRAALAGVPENDLTRKRILVSLGLEGGKCAAAACDALYKSDELSALNHILTTGDCFSLKRLAVKGDDLLALGFSGPELGNALNALLDYVLVHPAENARPILLEKAKAMKK